LEGPDLDPIEHITSYLAPGMLRALVAPPPADWTVATHHLLAGDLRHCTLCGARPEVLDQILVRHQALGIAVVCCLPCRSADPERERMRAVLAARYNPQRFSNNQHGGKRGPHDASRTSLVEYGDPVQPDG
jgi:hypothetical protein